MPKPQSPFGGLVCPWCGESDRSFSVTLADLDRLECRGCGESFTPHQAAVRAEQVLMGWDALGRWLRLAPAVAADAAEAAEEPPPVRRRHHTAQGDPVTPRDAQGGPVNMANIEAGKRILAAGLGLGYPGHDQYPRYGDGEDVPARASMKVSNGE